MLQIRTILLRGKGVPDAFVTFDECGNVLAGASDTGKSYLVHCLDYIFGAESMSKRIDEAEPYSSLFVELENSKAEFITLERGLAGGDIALHGCRLKEISGNGEKIAPKRRGKSLAKDITSALFAFAEIPEAQLRQNDRGQTVRLTLRTMLQLFLVDEVSVIDERSPVLGRASFDGTTRKRAFAYILSGKDDAGIVASERRDITAARLSAQLGIISDLLAPIEQRIQTRPDNLIDESIERVDDAIAALSQSLSDHSEERTALEAQRREAFATQQHAESQIIAIDELLKQYALLDDRYRTDLDRLDFISEGAHFFNGLQEVRCPLCDQLMSPDHAHTASEGSAVVYQAARAEASKILAHKKDLEQATSTLEKLRSTRESERNGAQQTIKRVDARIASILTPAMQQSTLRLDQLVARRVTFESSRSDEVLASNLRDMKERIEQASKGRGGPSKKWEPLPSGSLRKFCDEIEDVLKEWNWEGKGRVEFDEVEYDIKVDGQRRQSHGKGVRAVLHSAFVIGLLRYCHSNGRPHLGTVVIDSPLTSYKKGKEGDAGEEPINAGIEAAFWRSLQKIKNGLQVIIIENKEPPAEVARSVHYQWFAGKNAKNGERAGFIPR
jgi:hypothetical protein